MKKVSVDYELAVGVYEDSPEEKPTNPVKRDSGKQMVEKLKETYKL